MTPPGPRARSPQPPYEVPPEGTRDQRDRPPAPLFWGIWGCFALFSPSPEDVPGSPSYTGPAPQRPRGGAPPAAALTLPVKMSSPSESLSGAPGPRCSGKGGGRRSAGDGERDPWPPPDAIAAASSRARPAGRARHALTRGAGPRLRARFGLGSVSAHPAPASSDSQRASPLAGAASSPWERGVPAVPLCPRKEERAPSAREEWVRPGRRVPSAPRLGGRGPSTARALGPRPLHRPGKALVSPRTLQVEPLPP